MVIFFPLAKFQMRTVLVVSGRRNNIALWCQR